MYWIQNLSDFDHVLKFENINDDWDELSLKLGINLKPLCHKNKSEHLSFKDEFTKEMIEVTLEWFKDDFDQLEYGSTLSGCP